MFYAGDTYNFILNIPALGPGTLTVTSSYVLISVLDITNPGSPIVAGAHMTLIAGTSYIYYYSLTIPNVSPKDYVAIYSYSTSNSQSLGTATAATWATGIATFTFPLPLPPNAIPGNLLTTTGFTSVSGSYNLSAVSILTVDPTTGVITAPQATSTTASAGTLGTGVALANATVSNQLISSTDKVHVGDSNITGQVALNATVAQNATVAKDATVFKSAQWVSPQNDPLVQTINTAVQTILADSVTELTLLGTLASQVLDIHDNLFGTWTINQTLSPPILTLSRVGGGDFATFQLINNATTTQRFVLTHP